MDRTRSRKRKSAAALIVCYLVMLYAGVLYYPRWEHDGGESTISYDVSGYYMYLPAIFIYKDIKHCGFKDTILKKYSPTPDFQQAFVYGATGNYVMKYPAGQAILMAPWFFAAHVFASHSRLYPADGFSFPYQIAIGLGMLLYAFLGLFVLRKVLLIYYKDGTVALTLIALVVGSNYLNYAAVDQAMTHSTLFMVYACIIWFSIKFYNKPGLGLVMVMGGLCGLATLMRPTEIISVIIPVLWGVSSIKTLKERLQFFLKKPVYILCFGLCFAFFISIQLIYWKSVSGSWIVYSYQDQGFTWKHPHLKDYMFSFDTGWLRYSPMLFLAFIGLLPFIKRRVNMLPVVLFFLLNLYIVTAWDVWWYGGRAMVQSYAIAFFPVAALIEYVNDGRRWLKLLFYPFYLLFIYLNIWWTHGAHKGQYQVQGLSETYYWHMVGRWHATEADTKLLDNKDRYSGDTTQSVTLYHNDFSQDTSVNKIPDGIDGASIMIDPVHDTTAYYNVPLPPAGWGWIRVYADMEARDKEWDTWRMPQFIIKTMYKGRDVKVNMIRAHRFLTSRSPRNIYLDMQLPDAPFDQIVIRFWNAGSTYKTIIDNVTVKAFR